MNFKKRQLEFAPSSKESYGGTLLKKRKARQSGRPLSTRHTMHLVLRSTHAIGCQSFLLPANQRKIQSILNHFSEKYFVVIKSVANVGNHIHIHLKLGTRATYPAFIRAVTSSIAMAITKTSRWRTLQKIGLKRFWDYRPFTRVVIGQRAYSDLEDYLKINTFQGQGYNRATAQAFVWMSSG